MEWCEKNIVLSRSSVKQGLIDFEFTPYLREIVRTITLPAVERVTLCTSSQVGKSQALTCIGGFVTATRPTPILFAIATKDMAEEFAQEKLEPVIEGCAALRNLLLTGREDDKTLKKRFRNSTWVLEGGQSKRKAKMRSCGLLMLDETDELPPAVYAGFTQRIKSFPGAKIYEASTPDLETGHIWTALHQGSFETYHCPCPHCEELQPLLWEHLKFGEAKVDDKWDLRKLKEVTYYRCPLCGGRIEEKHKATMLNAGVWIAEHPERTTHRSFHLNALYSRLQKWSDVAKEFLNCEGVPELVKEWRTGSMAEPWGISARADIEGLIAQKCQEYERGQVPIPAGSLVLAADFGDTRVHWVVAAVSAADEKGRGGGATWIIDVGTDDDLEALARRKDAMNYGGLPVTFAAVDAGYDSVNVKDFCRRHNWIAIHGNTKIDTKTKINKLEGHLLVQVDLMKDILQDKIESEGGNWNLFREAEVPTDYFAQMAAERRIYVPAGFGQQRRKWQRMSRVNHFWDATVYVEAIAYHFGLRFRKPLMPAAPVEAKKKVEAKQEHMPTAFDRLHKYGKWQAI